MTSRPTTVPSADHNQRPVPSASRQIGRHAFEATIIGGAGKVAAAGREVVIAAVAGASVFADAYYIALVIPALLGGMVGNATHAAFVPLLTQIEAGDAARRRSLVNTVLTLTVLVGTVLCTVTVAVAPFLVRVVAPGLSPDGESLAAKALVIVAPTILIAPLLGLLTALLQVEGRFALAAVAYAALPVAGLALLVFLWPFLHEEGFAVTWTVSYLVSLAIALAMLRGSGHRIGIGFDVRSEEIRTLGRQLPGLLVVSMLVLANLAVDRAVASLIGVGAVAAFSYGSRLVLAPAEVLATALGSVLFPYLSRAEQRSKAEFADLLDRALVTLVVAVLPLAAIGAAVSEPLVRVVYERGAFGTAAVADTAAVVAWLFPVLVMTPAHIILTRAFQARLRSRQLAALAIANAGGNLSLNLFLAPVLGVGGIAAATSITLTMLVATMWWLARRDAGATQSVTVTVLRGLTITASSFGAAMGAQASLDLVGIDVAALAVIVGSAAGIATALVSSRLLGVSEPGRVLAVASRSILRRDRRRG